MYFSIKGDCGKFTPGPLLELREEAETRRLTAEEVHPMKGEESITSFIWKTRWCVYLTVLGAFVFILYYKHSEVLHPWGYNNYSSGMHANINFGIYGTFQSRSNGWKLWCFRKTCP